MATNKLKNGELKLGMALKRFVTVFACFYFGIAILFAVLAVGFNLLGLDKAIKYLADNYGRKIWYLNHAALTRVGARYLFHSWAAVLMILLFLARGAQLWLFKNYRHRYFIACMIMLSVIEYGCYTRTIFPFMDIETLEYNYGKTEENRFIKNLPYGTRIGYQATIHDLANERARLCDKGLRDLSDGQLKDFVNKIQPYDYLKSHVYPFDPKLSFFGLHNITIEKNLRKYYSRMARGNSLYEEGSRPFLENFNESSPLGTPVYAYLITQNTLNAPNLTMALKGGHYNIYKNETALPRAYFISDTIYEPDTSKALDILEDKKFDWEKRAVVHDEQLAMSSSSGRPGDYLIKELAIFYNDVKIIIENKKRGVLILNDIFHPYWKAFDNGKPAELFRINCIFRAIKLEAGSHVVEMNFYNPKLIVGIWVTMISTIICLAGLVCSYYNGRARYAD